jgi:hypothetical protein
MKTKSVFISFVLLLTLVACGEKDAPVLEGDIHGRVSLVDEYGYPITDKSGVKVRLTGEDTELETTTDSYGHYIFQNMPFGIYQINLTRENYVEKDWNVSFGHAGGEAPAAISQVMNKVPEFHYGIDSMRYDGYYFYIYLHIIDPTKAFSDDVTCYVHCFFSQSPDVSCENFENSFMWLTYGHNALYYSFGYAHNNFLMEYTGTVYCRIYAQTYYNEVWEGALAYPHPVYPETLGPPSEVFSFTVEGITRTNL